MQRSRVFGLATIGVTALALAHLAAGCGALGQVGDSCTKDFDCESDRCVQQVCMLAGLSPVALPDAAGETATDAAAEAAADAAKEAATDSGAGG